MDAHAFTLVLIAILLEPLSYVKVLVYLVYQLLS
jgi:hypothetical protein